MKGQVPCPHKIDFCHVGLVEFVLFFSLSFNQQSGYTLFYNVMCWLGISGMQERPPVVYLLFLSSVTIDVWFIIDEVSVSHTTMHHNRYDSSGQVVSSSQRPLPDNTQHLQETGIHAPGGIRTHDLSRRAAVHVRLRPRGHCDRSEYF